jgi:hypothetical protein
VPTEKTRCELGHSVSLFIIRTEFAKIGDSLVRLAANRHRVHKPAVMSACQGVQAGEVHPYRRFWRVGKSAPTYAVPEIGRVRVTLFGDDKRPEPIEHTRGLDPCASVPISARLALNAAAFIIGP